jgi:DNA-binding transcriptional LysR family regulator
LTTVGRDFLPQARRLVEETTAAVGRLKDLSRLGKGNITLASVPVMAHHTLPSVIRKYSEQYAGNRIRIIESNASDVCRAVLYDQAEFGITIQLERHAELVEEAVLRDPFMFFCRDGHPLSARKTVTWKELAGGELILVGGLSGNRALLDHQLARKRLGQHGTYEVEYLSTAIGMVSAGVGTAILPFSAIQENTHPMVRRIPLVGPVIDRTIVLIRKKNASLSPAAQIFYDLLAQQLKTTAKLSRKAKSP